MLKSSAGLSFGMIEAIVLSAFLDLMVCVWLD